MSFEPAADGLVVPEMDHVPAWEAVAPVLTEEDAKEFTFKVCGLYI